MIDEMFILRIPAILLALTVHEFAHGWIAFARGDPTARNNGRLTLNPISHLDPIGAVMLMFGPFGWAKPVPVNPYNLRNPRRDIVWVSLAGPLSNIVSAVVIGYLFRFLVVPMVPDSVFGRYVQEFFFLTIAINLGIALFNLIPIPPLDGSKILMGFLSPTQAQTYLRAMSRVPQIFLVLIILEWGLHIRTISFILDPIYQPFMRFWLWVIFGARMPL